MIRCPRTSRAEPAPEEADEEGALRINRARRQGPAAVKGAYVQSVTKGGGRQGGIMPGDLITEVNGKSTALSDVRSLIPVDKSVPLKIKLGRMA